MAVGILLYKDAKERQGIVEGIETITGGQIEHQIDMMELHGDNIEEKGKQRIRGKNSNKDNRLKPVLMNGFPVKVDVSRVDSRKLRQHDSHPERQKRCSKGDKYSALRRNLIKSVQSDTRLPVLVILYDNGGIVLRTWVPYGIFLAVNLALLIWGLCDQYMILVLIKST